MGPAIKTLLPQVLRASFFSAYGDHPREFSLVPRRCYDYELEFYIQSDGGVLVEGDYLAFRPGEIGFRRPGQVVCGIFPYSCHIVCFSVDGAAKTQENYAFGKGEEAEPDYENPLLGSLSGRITPESPDLCEKLFREISAAFAHPTALGQFEANALLAQLLGVLFLQSHPREGYNPRVLPVIAYLKENYCEEVSTGALIAASGLSKTSFHKSFRACVHCTPGDYILNLRMDKAKTLLHLTGERIAEVAVACGYLDNVYFTHLFKKHVGLTPSKYRHAVRMGELPPHAGTSLLEK